MAVYERQSSLGADTPCKHRGWWRQQGESTVPLGAVCKWHNGLQRWIACSVPCLRVPPAPGDSASERMIRHQMHVWATHAVTHQSGHSCRPGCCPRGWPASRPHTLSVLKLGITSAGQFQDLLQRLSFRLRDAFLPDPRDVTPDYWEWCRWRLTQVGVGLYSSSLFSSALFFLFSSVVYGWVATSIHRSRVCSYMGSIPTTDTFHWEW